MSAIKFLPRFEPESPFAVDDAAASVSDPGAVAAHKNFQPLYEAEARQGMPSTAATEPGAEPEGRDMPEDDGAPDSTFDADAFATRLAALVEDATAARRALECRLSEAIEAGLHAGFSGTLRDRFVDDIAFAVDRLADALPQPILAVRIHPDLAAALETAMAPHEPAEIKLVADGSLPLECAELHWADGGADLDLDRLTAHVTAAISTVISAKLPTHEDHHDNAARSAG